MKREFKFNDVKFAIVESDKSDFKWQAMVFDTNYNAWVCTRYYANTQSELKDIIKDNEIIKNNLKQNTSERV